MSASTTYPTIVLVHGAWHPPSMYADFVSKLTSASFDAVMPALPSCDSLEPGNATCSKDSDVVRNAILPLIEQGKDVIVVSHSYGGIPASGGAKGLSKSQRAKEGKKGGVIGLVHVSAFIVPEGSGLLAAMGGQYAPYVLTNDPTKHNTTLSRTRDTMFSDLSDTEAERLAGLLRPQAMTAFESSCPAPAWAEPEFVGRLGYIRCLNDQALLMEYQNMFIEKSGVEWKTKDIESGHAPFFGKPDDVVAFLAEWAEEWKE